MLSCFDRVWLWATLRTTLGSDSPGKKWPGPPPGDLPNPRIEPASCVSPAWADRFFITGASNATLSFTMRITTAYLGPCVGLFVCCWLLRGSSSLPAPSLRSHCPSSLKGHLPPPKLCFQVTPVPHGPACIYQEAFQIPTGAKGIFLTLCPQHFLFRCSRDLQG